MASIGELWLVDFGEPYLSEPAAHRPAVVIAPPDRFGSSFPFAIVAPLTTTRRGLSLHVEVDPTPESGLDEVSYVQCELIRSVNRRRLRHRLGTVDTETSLRVTNVIRTLLNH